MRCKKYENKVTNLLHIYTHSESNLISKLICLLYVETDNVFIPFEGGFTFCYTSHAMKMFTPHVHRARTPNRFKQKRIENRIRFADNQRCKFCFSLNAPGSARFAKVMVLRNGEKKHLFLSEPGWARFASYR